jgi:hypothetical protein
MTGGGLSAASAGGIGGDPASGIAFCAEIKVALIIFGGPFKSLAVLNSHLGARARHVMTHQGRTSSKWVNQP